MDALLIFGATAAVVTAALAARRSAVAGSSTAERGARARGTVGKAELSKRLFPLVADDGGSSAALQRQAAWAPSLELIGDALLPSVETLIVQQHRLDIEHTRLVSDDASDLAAAAAALASATVVALDLEHSPKSFHGYVCTVQVAVPGHPPFILDALQPALRSSLLPLLQPLLESPSVLKILHGGANDVRWLAANFGLYIVGPVLDTSIAAQALGLPASLGALAERLLLQHGSGAGVGGHGHGDGRTDEHGHGREATDDTAAADTGRSGHDDGYDHPVSLSALVYRFRDRKAHYQRVDWRRRPLPLDYQWYAAADAALLLPVAGHLIQQLAALDEGAAARDGAGQGAGKGRGSMAGGSDRPHPSYPRLLSVMDRSKAVTLQRYDAQAKEQLRLDDHAAFALKQAQEHPPHAHVHASGAGASGAAGGDAAWPPSIGATAAATTAAATAPTRATVIIAGGICLTPLQAAAVWLYVRLAGWRHEHALAVDAALEDVASNGHLWRLACHAAVAMEAQQAAGMPHSGGDSNISSGDPWPADLPTLAEQWCNELVHASHADEAAEALVAAVQELYPAAPTGVAAAIDGWLGGAAAAVNGDGRGDGHGVHHAAADGVASATPTAAGPALATGSQAAREAAKQARASRIFTPRAAPLYSNIELQAPDGTPMARIDRKKAQWYLDAGAADVVSGAETHVLPNGQLAEITADSGAEPLRLRLNREPKGMGHAGDPFHLAPRLNVCVVCGLSWEEARASGGLVRCYLIPRTHRHHFPLAAKSYTSHDVVLTCMGCHRRADVSASALTRTMCTELGVATGGGAVDKLRAQWFDEDRWLPHGRTRVRPLADVIGSSAAAGAGGSGVAGDGSIADGGSGSITTASGGRSASTRVSTASRGSGVSGAATEAAGSSTTASSAAPAAASTSSRAVASAPSLSSAPWPPSEKTLLNLLSTVRRLAHALVGSWPHIPQARREELAADVVRELDGVYTGAAMQAEADAGVRAEATGAADAGATATVRPSIYAALQEVHKDLHAEGQQQHAEVKDSEDDGTGEGHAGSGDAAASTSHAPAAAAATGSARKASGKGRGSDGRVAWQTHLYSSAAAKAFAAEWDGWRQRWQAEEAAGASTADPQSEPVAPTTSSALSVPDLLFFASLPTSSHLPALVRAKMVEMERDRDRERERGAGVGHGEETSTSQGEAEGSAAAAAMHAHHDDHEEDDEGQPEDEATGTGTGTGTTSSAASALNTLWADPAAHVLRHVVLGTAAWHRAAAAGRFPPVSSVQPEPAGPGSSVGLSGLPLDAEARLTVYVRRWRAYMQAQLRPVALADGWRVDYRVFATGHRTWDKEEPPLMKLVAAELEACQ